MALARFLWDAASAGRLRSIKRESKGSVIGWFYQRAPTCQVSLLLGIQLSVHGLGNAPLLLSEVFRERLGMDWNGQVTEPLKKHSATILEKGK